MEANDLKQIGRFMREMGTVNNIGNLNYNQVADFEPLRGRIGRAVDYATQGKIERWHQTLKNRLLLEGTVKGNDLEPDRGVA